MFILVALLVLNILIIHIFLFMIFSLCVRMLRDVFYDGHLCCQGCMIFFLILLTLLLVSSVVIRLTGTKSALRLQGKEALFKAIALSGRSRGYL